MDLTGPLQDIYADRYRALRGAHKHAESAELPLCPDTCVCGEVPVLPDERFQIAETADLHDYVGTRVVYVFTSSFHFRLPPLLGSKSA